MSVGTWMDANLATQGYRLQAPEQRALGLGLRFSTGLCLVLTTVALASMSALAFAGLTVIGLVAGFAPRHPFDYLWNGGVRHLFGAPALPPSPARRRHAFKMATVLMGAIAILLALGASTAAIVVGGLTIAACTAVTVANLCLPSLALSLIEQRQGSAAGSAPSTSLTS